MAQPVKLKPVYKDYLWGGSKLKDQFNKDSDQDVVAESWELSSHKDGLSTVDGSSKTILDLIQESNGTVLGTKVTDKSSLPIMIKFIDAKDNLSIQVHPDDDYANRVEGDNGKTEMWIVLEAEPGSSLYFGVKEDISREEAEERIKAGTFEDVLNKVPLSAGDIFMIPAGTIHAIGKGIVICEIQQSSNVTYRLYDYKRKDAAGNERELHIEKGLDVSNLKKSIVDPSPEAVVINQKNQKILLLKSSKYFNTFEYILKDDASAVFETSTNSFASIICIEGNAVLTSDEKGVLDVPVSKGDTIFIPAADQQYELTGTGRFIFVTV